MGRVETWVLSAGVSVGARWEPTPRMGITPNLRADLGYVSMSGVARDGGARQGQGASVVLVASIRVDAALGDRFLLVADLDLGPTLVGHVARAGDVAVAGIRGVALGFRVGFGFVL